MRKLLLIAALAGATPAAAQLVNGGFENPPAPPSQGYDIYFGGDNFGGWTVTGSNVVVLLSTYAESGLTFNAFDGTQALDLSGAANQGPLAGVFQNVNTVSGKRYNLSFRVGNADGTNNANFAGPSSVGVQIGNGPLQIFTNEQITSGGINWALNSLSFAGTGGPTRIAFFNATAAGDFYSGVDAVSLAAVPEPAQWAMMLGGFGFAGAALRRRRRTTGTVTA